MTRLCELATTQMEGTLPQFDYRPAGYRDTKRLPIPTAVRREAVWSDRQTGGTVLIGFRWTVAAGLASPVFSN